MLIVHLYIQQDIPPLTTVMVYLGTGSDLTSAEEILTYMIEKLGGIPIIRRN